MQRVQNEQVTQLQHITHEFGARYPEGNKRNLVSVRRFIERRLCNPTSTTLDKENEGSKVFKPTKRFQNEMEGNDNNFDLRKRILTSEMFWESKEKEWNLKEAQISKRIEELEANLRSERENHLYFKTLWDNRHSSQSARKEEVQAIAKLEREAFYAEILEELENKERKSLSNLAGFDAALWLDRRNPVVVAFIHEITWSET